MQVLGPALRLVVAVLVGVEVGVVGARERVLVGEVQAVVPRIRLDADLDAAERLGQVVEPGQVHFHEVVDLHAGDRLHRVDRRHLASLVGVQEPVRLVLGGVLVQVLRVRPGVSGVDLSLGVTEVLLRELDQVITRDRETHGLLAASEDVNQDQRVRVLAAVAAGVEHHLHVVVQLVALVVRAALQAHHQDVHLADRGVAAGDGDALTDFIYEADFLVGVAGYH